MIRDRDGNAAGYLFIVPLPENNLPTTRSLDRSFFWTFSGAALFGVVMAVLMAIPLGIVGLALLVGGLLVGRDLLTGGSFYMNTPPEEWPRKVIYLLFYLLCGLVASFAHIALNPTSPIPTVGASGAISGVLSAYLLFFPTARVILAAGNHPCGPGPRGNTRIFESVNLRFGV